MTAGMILYELILDLKMMLNTSYLGKESQENPHV